MRDEWLEDLQNRQRNIVFPDTVQNEARFWRNLGSTPWKTPTKLGMVVLAVFVGAWIAVFVVASLRGGFAWKLALMMLLVWGPIFAAVAWATRRTLKSLEKGRRDWRTPRH